MRDRRARKDGQTPVSQHTVQGGQLTVDFTSCCCYNHLAGENAFSAQVVKSGKVTTMLRNKNAAFTLIELLLVVAIIAVLMTMLLPAISAVQQAGMSKETETRIAIISAAIDQYANTYDGIYPPSNRSETWNYPRAVIPASEDRIPWFNPNHVGPSYSTNHGHSLLTYFLMGPSNYGWLMDTHGVKREWVPPETLQKYLTEPTIVGRAATSSSPKLTDSSFAYYGFADAWGPDGTRYNLVGAFQYSLKNPRTGGYQTYDMYHGYYWGGCRGYEGGDGSGGHMDRVFKNIGSAKYVLVSAGPDRKFGFYRFDPSQNRVRADSELGTSDDIANIPID